MMKLGALALAVSAFTTSPALADPSSISVDSTVTISQFGHALIDVTYQCGSGTRAFLSATISQANKAGKNVTFGHSPASPNYACEGGVRTVTLTARPDDNQVFIPGQGTVNADVSTCDELFNCQYQGQTTQSVNLIVAK